MITSERVEVLGWLDILQIPVVFSLCSWITHCPGKLRPDKIEGGGVIDEDGVETDVGPGGVDDDVEAEDPTKWMIELKLEWRVEWMLKNDLVE